MLPNASIHDRREAVWLSARFFDQALAYGSAQLPALLQGLGVWRSLDPDSGARHLDALGNQG
jgi:hypothetical protein